MWKCHKLTNPRATAHFRVFTLSTVNLTLESIRRRIIASTMVESRRFYGQPVFYSPVQVCLLISALCNLDPWKEKNFWLFINFHNQFQVSFRTIKKLPVERLNLWWNSVNILTFSSILDTNPFIRIISDKNAEYKVSAPATNIFFYLSRKVIK